MMLHLQYKTLAPKAWGSFQMWDRKTARASRGTGPLLRLCLCLPVMPEFPITIFVFEIVHVFGFTYVCVHVFQCHSVSLFHSLYVEFGGDSLRCWASPSTFFVEQGVLSY